MLQGWADYLRTAPDELTSTADFANPFRGPEAPVEIHVAFDGDDPELAAQAIDPIRRLGTVTGDDIALRPYADTLVDGTPPPPGLQFVIRSAFVGTESVSEVLQILAEAGASERSPFIAVRSVGGAVSRVPGDATAYAHRQAELMVVTTIAGRSRPSRPLIQLWKRSGKDSRPTSTAPMQTSSLLPPRRMSPQSIQRRPISGSRRSSAGTTPAICSPATTTSGLTKPRPTSKTAAPHTLWGRRPSAERRPMPLGRPSIRVCLDTRPERHPDQANLQEHAVPRHRDQQCGRRCPRRIAPG